MKGWHVVIDELPERAVLSGQFGVGATWAAHADRYDLVQASEGSDWYAVVLKPGRGLNPGEIGNDAKDLQEFHRCIGVAGRSVYVDIADWQHAQGAKKKVRWRSCWTPEGLLQHAASVTILGAGLESSLMYKAAQHAASGPISFKRETVRAGRKKQPRVLIHYYVRERGSTAFWGKDKGSKVLVAISRHLEKIAFDGYWSGNEVARPYFRHRLEGQECQPKVAGTNSLRAHTRCAFIYSNKAQAADRPITELFGMTADDIRKAREDEDIIQFVFRGALRDPAFHGTYEVHLYDEHQAEMLKNYLIQNGVTSDVHLVPVEEAGVLDERRTMPRKAHQSGRSDDPVNPVQADAEKAEAARQRSQRTRDRNKGKAIAAGIPQRKPGRPKKVSLQAPEAAGSQQGALCEGSFSAELRAAEETDTVIQAAAEAPGTWADWTDSLSGWMADVALASAPPPA